MIWAQYDIVTGIINATNSLRVDDDTLLAEGRAQIEVPDGVDGSICSIDLATLQPILLPPSA